MANKRVDEATINASLDAFLHGSRAGDVEQARHLHEMLDLMLTEREGPDGQLWLTDHGKMLLADMHRELSKCDGCGDRLRDIVLDAVRLGPHKGHWHDTSSFVRDLQIATAVADELCAQRDAELKPDLGGAAEIVSERGGFGMSPPQICEVYEQIAESVEGFREISRG